MRCRGVGRERSDGGRQDFLGHATVATTETYYINTKPALRAAAQAREVYTDPGDSQANDA